MTTFSLDTNVIISHLRGDRFSQETDRFFQRMAQKRTQLIVSDIVYSELYTGIFLSREPDMEENRVQSLLAVNDIQVRSPKTLKMARRAGELYARYLGRDLNLTGRTLPDFLIAAQAEASSEGLVTWNATDYKTLELAVPILTPPHA
ncbi:MAG: type II toxin-antitoxin system VapC family toxin [Nitrososphaerales archaeon]